MKKFMLVFGLILALAMSVSAFAEQVPVSIASVKIDGEELSTSSDNVRNLERGEEFDVKVLVKANEGIAASGNETMDVQVFAFVSGFEHSRTDSMSDETRAFDLEAGHSIVKTLTLKLPERADEDNYRLRVVVADRNSEPVEAHYRIKIEPSDTQVVIRDFELSPEEEVQAGRAVLATVRVKNLGDSDEDDVKIKVSIPELGVSATPDFIDELEADESATSEEFFLKINSCTKPGIYDVVSEVTFDEGDEKVTAKKAITVTKGSCEAVQEPGQAEVSGKTTIAYSTEAQSITAGGPAASYPITITNSGASTRAFVLSVDGAGWADFSISPSNLVTVKQGSTQTVFVSVSAKAGTQAGERVFTVSVKDSAGSVLQTLALKADVAAAAAKGISLAGLRGALTAGLVVVVAVIVVCAAGAAVRLATPPLPETLHPARTLVSVFQLPEPKVRVISPEVAEGVRVTA